MSSGVCSIKILLCRWAGENCNTTTVTSHHDSHRDSPSLIQRSSRYDTVNLTDFKDVLENLDPTNIGVSGQQNVKNATASGCEVLDSVARRCRNVATSTREHGTQSSHAVKEDLKQMETVKIMSSMYPGTRHRPAVAIIRTSYVQELSRWQKHG